MESLKAWSEHRTIFLNKQPGAYVHLTPRINAEQVPIVRSVVDRAESKPVYNRSDPLRLPVTNDMRGLQEVDLAKLADGAAPAVRSQHLIAESALVSTSSNQRERVATRVW